MPISYAAGFLSIPLQGFRDVNGNLCAPAVTEKTHFDVEAGENAHRVSRTLALESLPIVVKASLSTTSRAASRNSCQLMACMRNDVLSTSWLMGKDSA